MKDKVITHVTGHFIQYHRLADQPPGQQRQITDESIQLNEPITQAGTACITRFLTIPLQLGSWCNENLGFMVI